MSLCSLEELDFRLKQTCDRSGLKLRSAGNGLWLCTVIPVALLCHVYDFNRFSELYKIISVVGVGQLVCAIANILQHGFDQIPYESMGLLFSTTAVSLLLVFCTDRNIVLILCVAVLSSSSYFKIFKTVTRSCPQSFTFGEATLVAQAFVLYLSSFGTNLILHWSGSSSKRCDETATFILQAGFFAVVLLLLAVGQFPEALKNSLVFILVLCSAGGALVVGLPSIIIKKNSLSWLLQLMNTQKSIALLTLWVICCLAAIYCLFVQCKESKPASTAVRKSFHFLILVVLLPGLIAHPCLMYFASGVAFALMIVIETVRQLKLTSHATALQSCFEAYKDEKDEGELALTPLYLMAGCAAPIWIYPFSYSTIVPLPILAGVLTVAVGDSMASVGGAWFGYHRWPKTTKTIEGTCFCFLSQIVSVLLLDYFGFIRSTSLIWLSCALVVISVLEALTDQIDNLVLPFISYILFSIAA